MVSQEREKQGFVMMGRCSPCSLPKVSFLFFFLVFVCVCTLRLSGLVSIVLYLSKLSGLPTWGVKAIECP